MFRAFTLHVDEREIFVASIIVFFEMQCYCFAIFEQVHQMLVVWFFFIFDALDAVDKLEHTQFDSVFHNILVFQNGRCYLDVLRDFDDGLDLLIHVFYAYILLVFFELCQ